MYVRPFGSFGTLSSGFGVTAGVFGSAGLDGSNVTGFVVYTTVSLISSAVAVTCAAGTVALFGV